MSSQGPLYPSSGSGAGWTSPTNVVADDGSVASISLPPTGSSGALLTSGHGFSVPGGSTILGITVEVKRSTSSFTNTIKDNTVKLAKAGVAGGTDNADSAFWPTSAAYFTYGSSADLWGQSWTASDINNAGFGVAYSVRNAGASSDVANVDTIRVTVTYSAAAAPGDDEQPDVERTQTVSWTPAPATDDETGPQLKNFALEQEEPWTAQTVARLWNPVAATDDEAAQFRLFFLDQEEPYVAQTVLRLWNPVAVSDDDQYVTPPTPFGSESEEFWVAQRTNVLWTPAPFLDDEVRSVPPSVEDDRAWAPEIVRSPWTSVVFSDDEVTFKLHVDQEEFWTGQTVRSTWNAATFLDDQVVSTPGEDQEDPWVGQVVRTVWNPTPFFDDETGPRLVNVDIEGLEPYIPFAVQYVWTAVTFLDDEVKGGMAVEVEEPWEGRVVRTRWDSTVFADEHTDAGVALEVEEPYEGRTVRTVWTAAVFTDDEASVSLRLFSLDQEEPYVAQRTGSVWAPVPSLDDEVKGGMAAEVEEPWTPQTVMTPWVPVAFTDDETGSTLRRFSLDQEEPWTAAYVRSTWTPSPFQDDEADGGTVFEQEDDYRRDTVRTAWTATVFQDDEAGPFLVRLVDDEWYTPPATVRTQWSPTPFQDDEVGAGLKYIAVDCDEPYNDKTVRSVWNPTAFTDDEVKASVAVEVEEWYSYATTAAWRAVTATDDEAGVRLSNVAVDCDEGYTPGRVLYVWTPTTFVDEGPKTATCVEVDQWVEPKATFVVWSNQVFLSDEEYMQLYSGIPGATFVEPARGNRFVEVA